MLCVLCTIREHLSHLVLTQSEQVCEGRDLLIELRIILQRYFFYLFEDFKQSLGSVYSSNITQSYSPKFLYIKPPLFCYLLLLLTIQPISPVSCLLSPAPLFLQNRSKTLPGRFPLDIDLRLEIMSSSSLLRRNTKVFSSSHIGNVPDLSSLSQGEKIFLQGILP